MKKKIPVTQAIRFLRAHHTEYEEFLYDYEPHGGTHQFASLFNIDEHAVIKTLIAQDVHKKPLIVLMHGDKEVSFKQLAREVGYKEIRLCDPAIANHYSGYLTGGTSPFATRVSMPVYLQETILELPRIYINGGHRGLIIGLDSSVLVSLLNPILVNTEA